jgi:succinate dehydrogenase/fumarate reductase flavoprotein subunit
MRLLGAAAVFLSLCFAATACTDPTGADSHHRHHHSADTQNLPDSAETGADTGDTGDSEVLGPPDEVTGVLIVGAGVAGLAAAVEARADGADVLVIERKSIMGGVAPLTGGLLLFAGTPEQAAADVVDSPEELFDEWPDITGGDTTDPWVQNFISENVTAVHDWLQGLGAVVFLNLAADAASGLVPRVHQPTSGGGMLPAILQNALPSKYVLLSHEATGLVRDDDGNVIGVRYKDRSVMPPRSGWIYATRTIMATGGFLRDVERVRELRPDLEEVPLWFGCGPEADGNGQDMLESIGAGWDNGSAIGLYLHGVPDPRPGQEGEELNISTWRRNEGIWIGPDGHRFTRENRENSFTAAEAAVAFAGGVVWFVLDQEGWDGVSLIDPMVVTPEEAKPVDRDELIDAGWAYQGETLEDLAAAIDVPASTLEEEVVGFNAWANGKAPDAWHLATDIVAPPIDAAPFFAVRLVVSLAKGFGGIEVDTQGHVLDGEGQRIPGVLAAGELTGMAGGSLVGNLGFTGSFSAIVYGARVAGATAAAESLGVQAP